MDFVFYMIMPATTMFYGRIPQDTQAALNWNVSLIRSNELTKKLDDSLLPFSNIKSYFFGYPGCVNLIGC